MGAMRHQPHDCLLNRFIQAQIKENIKAPRHWSLCWEFPRWPVNSPHQWPVTREMVPFDDVIMDSFVNLTFSSVTAINHEMASKELKYTFATSEISLTEKVINMGLFYNRNKLAHQWV